MMTVAQLIETLKEMPQDAQVVYSIDAQPEHIDAVFKPNSQHPWKVIEDFRDKVILW